MQPKATTLVLEASEDNKENIASTASDKRPTGQEAEATSERLRLILLQRKK